MSNEINVDNLRVSPEQMAAWQASKAEKTKQTDQAEVGKSKRSKEYKLEFYKFPSAVIDGLVAAGYAPAWKVAAAIYKQWYATFRGNPVKLTSQNLRENYGVSKNQKWRALKILEAAGQYVVERTLGHNPLVTMKWEPLKAPNQY